MLKKTVLEDKLLLISQADSPIHSHHGNPPIRGVGGGVRVGVDCTLFWKLTNVVRDWWSDVLRSNDEGIGMTVGLELSQPARQCEDKPTASVGSKLERLWGLNRCGERRDDRGTLTLRGRK